MPSPWRQETEFGSSPSIGVENLRCNTRRQSRPREREHGSSGLRAGPRLSSLRGERSVVYGIAAKNVTDSGEDRLAPFFVYRKRAILHITSAYHVDEPEQLGACGRRSIDTCDSRNGASAGQHTPAWFSGAVCGCCPPPSTRKGPIAGCGCLLNGRRERRQRLTRPACLSHA